MEPRHLPVACIKPIWVLRISGLLVACSSLTDATLGLLNKAQHKNWLECPEALASLISTYATLYMCTKIAKWRNAP